MYLGIDCGTQGTKALLVNAAGQPLGRGYARHALVERMNGAREQDPAWWVEALRTAAKSALQPELNVGPVEAIGVSGQQHGLVVLDEAMQVIRPAKLWNDTETAPQNEEIQRRFGGPESFRERFGIVPLTGYTVSKLLWMAEREPHNFARIRHILLPHEYLNFWLTGELCAERGDASGTGYFDVRSGTWAREVLDVIDGGTGQLAAALPRLVTSTEIVGRLRPQVAEELGLPKGCVVSSGGGDNMMGAIGTANVREGVVTLSLGTSSTVYSFSRNAPEEASGGVAPFCASSGGWLPLVCTMNATNVVTATVELLGKTVADIDAALADTPPGADGLVFLPYLNGERTPDLPSARGSLHGISAANYTPAHMVRAAVEGVSFGILQGLDMVLNGRRAETILVIGGGARSRGWRQLLADATGATIYMPEEEESGCLGAAVQARVALAHSNGQPLSFAKAAEEMVRLREESKCSPRPETRAQYDVARLAFRRQMLTSYPVLEQSQLSPRYDHGSELKQ